MRTETHSITWRSIAVEINFTPEKLRQVDHIEIRSLDKIPLPVTETGYRSHFVGAGIVAEDGGAVAYVVTWLDYEAMRTRWDGAQLSLF